MTEVLSTKQLGILKDQVEKVAGEHKPSYYPFDHRGHSCLDAARLEGFFKGMVTALTMASGEVSFPHTIDTVELGLLQYRDRRFEKITFSVPPRDLLEAEISTQALAEPIDPIKEMRC